MLIFGQNDPQGSRYLGLEGFWKTQEYQASLNNSKDDL
jgi:hypothetical protein